MSQSGPRGTSAVPKGTHSRERSQPLMGPPQRGGLGQMLTPADKRVVRKLVLFIIPVCFADSLYGLWVIPNYKITAVLLFNTN